jgi:hypothetical protein
MLQSKESSLSRFPGLKAQCYTCNAALVIVVLCDYWSVDRKCNSALALLNSRRQIQKAARRVRIGLQAGSPENANLVLRKFFLPKPGTIQDFVFDESRQEFIIIANQRYLWRWSEGERAKPIKDDVPLLTIAGCCSGENYVHMGNDHELLRICPIGGLKSIKRDCYLATMGLGYESEGIIVAEGPSAVDGVEPVSRLQDGRFVQSDKMGAAFLSDLIEWLPGTICCTLEDQSVIYSREEGISRELFIVTVDVQL